MFTSFIVILIIIIVIGWLFMSKYNFMVKLRNIRKQSFSDIDVQLKLRFNLIPNLINTIKWYAKHEKETFELITKARTSFLNAWNDVNKKIESDNMLSGALKSIFAVAEAYPKLKTNTNFIQLQTELSDIENKISAARRFFNNATQEYNTFTQMFPNNIIAWIFNFNEETLYEIQDKTQKENITVEF